MTNIQGPRINDCRKGGSGGGKKSKRGEGLWDVGMVLKTFFGAFLIYPQAFPGVNTFLVDLRKSAFNTGEDVNRNVKG